MAFCAPSPSKQHNSFNQSNFRTLISPINQWQHTIRSPPDTKNRMPTRFSMAELSPYTKLPDNPMYQNNEILRINTPRNYYSIAETPLSEKFSVLAKEYIAQNYNYEEKIRREQSPRPFLSPIKREESQPAQKIIPSSNSRKSPASSSKSKKSDGLVKNKEISRFANLRPKATLKRVKVEEDEKSKSEISEESKQISETDSEYQLEGSEENDESEFCSDSEYRGNDEDSDSDYGSPKSGGIYKCECCARTFKTAQAKGGHMSRKHPGKSSDYTHKKVVRQAREYDRARLKLAKIKYFKDLGLNYEELNNSKSGKAKIKEKISRARIKKIKPLISEEEINAYLATKNSSQNENSE